MAAETMFWKGGTDGKWKLKTNWETVTGAEPADYPGEAENGDSVVFDKRSAVSITEFGAALSFTLANFTVEDGYTGSPGTIDVPINLKQSAVNTSLVYNGRGAQAWILGSFTTVTVNGTGSGVDALHLNAGATAVYTNLYVRSGVVVLDDSNYGVSSNGAATIIVTQPASGSAPTLTVKAPITTTIEVRGGRVYWNKGTVTKMDNHGGIFTGEQSTIARTLTDANLWGGVTDLRTGVAGAITVTNPIAYKSDIAQLRYDADVTVALST